MHEYISEIDGGGAAMLDFDSGALYYTPRVDIKCTQWRCYLISDRDNYIFGLNRSQLFVKNSSGQKVYTDIPWDCGAEFHGICVIKTGCTDTSITAVVLVHYNIIELVIHL